ncbi:MAG: LysR family transcriptional regulator [Propionibacteriaceae bacterium]|nr:LysR family transcriptional regulator [Micropruina sp.]
MTVHDPKLDTFIRVAELGSFAKAAQAGFVSSVSVMKQVNALERHVGVRLVVRSNHGVTPTPAGAVLLEDARRMVVLSAEAVAAARRAADTGKQVIRVGTSLLRPCRELIDLWTRLNGGALPFRLEVVAFDDQGNRLMSTLTALGSQLDCFLGPTGAHVYREQLGVLPLRDLPCELAVPRRHRLAGRARLDWADLRGETLMMVPRGVAPQLDALRDGIASSHPDVTVVDSDAFYDMATFNEAERRGTLLVSLGMWADVHPGLVTVPVAWDAVLPFGILHAAQPSPHLAAFLAAISDETTKNP